MKKHYKEEEKQYHVSSWQQSGYSIAAYSRSAGLKPQTFYNWTKKYGPVGPGDGIVGGFIAQGPCPGEKPLPKLEIDLGDGVVLRVY